MQTIHCYVGKPPLAQDVQISVLTLNGSLALFRLYVNGQQYPNPPGGGGFSASCLWTVPKTANPCQCDLHVLPAQQGGQSADAQISITQSGHVVVSHDNNGNVLGQPIKLKGTASGSDGLATIFLNYYVGA